MKYINTKHELGANGMSEEELHRQGYDELTYDEFKKKYEKEHPPTEEQVKESKEQKQKRMASMRLAKDIEAYQNQGKEASPTGFKLGKKPSLLSIPLDGLEQDLYLFSPEWQRIQGASKLSDDEILGLLGEQDKVAIERAKEAKRQIELKKQEEEREKRRQHQILDYSAKVSGGFIEVKIGEDVEEMHSAWVAHLNTKHELGAKGMSEDELNKRGFYEYSWEEWKKHYRKMHGLPEDGIRRIPYEGKKKERDIDWSTRFALSPNEMKKYGIEMSKDGPIMIPMDKAIDAVNSILNEAKTIHSIRDGLEVMKMGLDSGTMELKKRRENGIPVGIVQGENDNS